MSISLFYIIGVHLDLHHLMKKFVLFLALFSVAASFVGCEDDIYHGNWIEISTLNAKGRANSSLFLIDDKAYVTGGYGYYYVPVYFNTTYAFDANNYSWTECDTMPCMPRMSGVSFSINGKGYYCGGMTSDGEYHNELFEFDPSQPAGSQWREMVSDTFPGGRFRCGLGFAIDGCGYVGSGINEKYGTSNQYFKFDPTKPEGSRWSEISTPNALRRYDASVFVIGSRAFIIGGRNNNREVKQFECYDASSDKFTIISDDMLRDYNVDILYRYSASAFSIGNDGYVTCGVKFTGEVLRDTWRFTPDVNNGKGSWQLIGDFEGPSRYAALSFSYNNYGFIICGQNGAFSSSFKDDVWRFSPDEKYNWHTSR